VDCDWYTRNTVNGASYGSTSGHQLHRLCYSLCVAHRHTPIPNCDGFMRGNPPVISAPLGSLISQFSSGHNHAPLALVHRVEILSCCRMYDALSIGERFCSVLCPHAGIDPGCNMRIGPSLLQLTSRQVRLYCPAQIHSQSVANRYRSFEVRVLMVLVVKWKLYDGAEQEHLKSLSTSGSKDTILHRAFSQMPAIHPSTK